MVARQLGWLLKLGCRNECIDRVLIVIKNGALSNWIVLFCLSNIHGFRALFVQVNRTLKYTVLEYDYF